MIIAIVVAAIVAGPVAYAVFWIVMAGLALASGGVQM